MLTTTNSTAVVKICVRLDGLPLAIELAAACSKLLTPQALLAKLEQDFLLSMRGTRDAPPRQQTLRNTIAWSYELLNDEETTLFRRLAVFSGGSTLPAIEAMYTALGEDATSVLHGVSSLIDKSLLQPVLQEEEEEYRYVMLKVFREYGLEALVATQEMETIRMVHSLCYLTEKVEPKRIGSQQALWLNKKCRSEGGKMIAEQILLPQNLDAIFAQTLLGAANNPKHLP